MNRLIPLTLSILGLLGLNDAEAQTSSFLTIPKIGTYSLPSGTEGESLPLDKPYGKLTYDQKKIVRSWYESLDENDEPPYPIDGMRSIVDEVSKVRGKVNFSGRFFAAAHVDAKGHADTVSIYSIPDPRLKDVLALILISTSYKPARCNGKPCAMDFPVDVNFE